MGNGYKLDRGFLFDRSWEKQFRKLKPKDFYALFWELYDFQQSGGSSEVGDHDDNVLMSSIVTFVVPQLRNRINGSQRKQCSYEKDAVGRVGGGVPRGARGTPQTENELFSPPDPLKLREVKLREVKLRESEYTPAHEENGKRPFGEYANVLLTERERSELNAKYGETAAEHLINVFSRKLKAKGYKYDDHFAAIVMWAEEDGTAAPYCADKSAEAEKWFEDKLKQKFG